MDTMLAWRRCSPHLSFLLCIFSPGVLGWLLPYSTFHCDFFVCLFVWLSLTKHPPLEINGKVTNAHTWDQYLAAVHHMKEIKKQRVPLTVLMAVISPYQCPGKGEESGQPLRWAWAQNLDTHHLQRSLMCLLRAKEPLSHGVWVTGLKRFPSYCTPWSSNVLVSDN